MSYISEKELEELENRIRSKDFKLNSLLEITKAINSNAPVSDILNIYNYVLTEQLGIRKFILFNHQGEWKVLDKMGIKGKVKDIDVEQDFLRFTDITVIESSYKQSLDKFDVVIPVHHKDKPLAFLVMGGVKDQLMSNDRRSFANLNFIQTLTNIIVVAIENKRLAKQSILQEAVKKELEIASEMQRLLFPDHLPSNDKIDISAKYLSHSQVSGDYYDYIQINKDEFIICIADVSGKGIAAAMLMANFQATVRTLYTYKRFSLEDLVHELNTKFFDSAKGEKFVTFFIAEYNSKNRKLKYVNAGHNWPILIKGKTARFLNKGCIGLGMLKEIPFLESETVEIEQNTTLILYTDGIVELENNENEQFQTDRLTKIVQNFYPLSMEDLNEIIFSKLDDWRGKRKYVDDTAILSCRIF
ncbi:PP2C family protein-serine/threonine phosphatase [Paracrocinitomix mangrovi]|uniref:GAF domain-containing SpoIIE family protein phosphatase n=1 Tax=Paracrocinitomix mangrovi TaxID=2862509 RepID=UPI001C8DD756|nr:PP2C family protein-serine/threonine phosphatase [Paracrocinitomix mangrovi]UKN03015.1 PP2C family protein-serine/threonine phosphatase [Paracrocinitomix mangrovi]